MPICIPPGVCILVKCYQPKDDSNSVRNLWNVQLFWTCTSSSHFINIHQAGLVWTWDSWLSHDAFDLSHPDVQVYTTEVHTAISAFWDLRNHHILCCPWSCASLSCIVLAFEYTIRIPVLSGNEPSFHLKVLQPLNLSWLGVTEYWNESVWPLCYGIQELISIFMMAYLIIRWDDSEVVDSIYMWLSRVGEFWIMES